MIPKRIEALLRERLPEIAWENRLVQEGERCYVEFGPRDVDRLARLGINVDSLGPRLVVVMWDAGAPQEVGGYLVVDNLSMGRPSVGGIRMLPDMTPASTFHLARCMTLKNAAAQLPFGGGKAGIVAERSLSPDDRVEVVRRFARLLYRYHELFLPGPDVGTNDADMKTIAIENGLDTVLSKPADMGGSQVDELGAAAGGLVIALEALLEEMPRLHSLPQFADLRIPHPEDLTVLIQGFGAVGAHTARLLNERLPRGRTTGISDAGGYLYDEEGLPANKLFQYWQEGRLVTRDYYREEIVSDRWGVSRAKFCNHPNDLLRESAFCMIPAAPVANYLDIDALYQPSMTVKRMGNWAVIIEGSNTYSPDPARKAARARMERAVYRERGVLIATDFLVNSGGVIFAAQEQLIKTPEHLRIPADMLGNRGAVERWLHAHAEDLKSLAEKRRQAAEAAREESIRRNMRELIDLLVADIDTLPYEAAERISIRRIAAQQNNCCAAELMTPIPTLALHHSVREAAAHLVEAGSPILAVLEKDGSLAGVVTEWDVTRATAQGSPDGQPLEAIMTRQVIAAAPDDSLVEILRQLEYHEISALPVVENGRVLGMVSADLLARRSLLHLLQES